MNQYYINFFAILISLAATYILSEFFLLHAFIRVFTKHNGGPWTYLIPFYICLWTGQLSYMFFFSNDLNKVPKRILTGFLIGYFSGVIGYVSLNIFMWDSVKVLFSGFMIKNIHHYFIMAFLGLGWLQGGMMSMMIYGLLKYVGPHLGQGKNIK